MKNLHLRHFVTLLVIGFLATSVLAEPGEGRGRGQKDPGKRLENMKTRLIDATDATEEQQEQIEQILDTHAQAVKNWHSENKDKVKAAWKKLKQAKQADNKEAIQAAKDELKTVRQGRRELRVNLKKQLAEVLDKEQMKKAKQAIQPRRGRRGDMDGKGPHGRRGYMDGRGPRGRKGRGMFGQLDLTGEQKEQIKGIMKDAHKKAKAAKGKKDKRKILKAARKKVHDEIFTDAQRTKAKELRRKHHPLAGIASDEQIDKANDIMTAAHKEAAKAKTPKEGRKIIKAARDKIKNEILTKEQRKKLKAQRKDRRNKMRSRFMKGLGLTEEQQTQADKILDEAREEAQATEDPIEHQIIMLKAHKRVRDEVMTDEQRDKLKDMRKKRGWGKKGKGPRGRRGKPGRRGRPDREHDGPRDNDNHDED